jgi:hypothetical protein
LGWAATPSRPGSTAGACRRCIAGLRGRAPGYLAQVLSRQQVEASIHEADYRRLTSAASLPTLLARYPRRPGGPVVRAVLARRERHRTRTEMEADFLAFLDEHGLARPLTNVARTIHGRWIEADAVYPDQQLVVELDGGSHR